MPLVRSLLAALLVPLSALAAITPANVTSLAQKWDVPLGAVTGGAVARDGRLYVGAWSSKVFALDPRTGGELWSRPVAGAVPGRVLLLDDGGLCYGTLGGEVGCLDGAAGDVRWQKSYADPLQGVVWSTPTAANGMLFVPIAGLADNPCSRGRLLRLDLATGDEKWRLYTIPEKICHTDTSIECTTDGDCPAGGPCEIGRGAGVTAQPVVDPTGQWVYMNTVGCYTFPSIGDSDSMFKVAASTGEVEWKQRVSQPEQFGTCQNDTSIDCGLDADCGVGNTCTKKGAYHDFGFVNGPLRIDAPDGVGGMRTLIVSGSKNGTLYAFNEDGTEAWHNTVRSEPVSPGFAGFGLFNGELDYADGRIFAALNYMIPARVCSNDPKKGCDEDADCPGGTCPVEHKHLMAFDAIDGHILWEEEIGRSYSHVAVVNGIVWAGTNDTDDAGTSWLYAHDAATGARLATFPLPKASAARVAVDDTSVYVGYGVLSPGGMLALSLCGNGTIDPGETCDPGAVGTGCCTASCTRAAEEGATCDDGDACTTGDTCVADVCTGSTVSCPDDGNPCTDDVCVPLTGACGIPRPGACDDGDACTRDDSCGDGGACAGRIGTLDDVGCAIDKLQASPCGDVALPGPLAKALAKTVKRIGKLFDKAAGLVSKGKAERAEKLRTQAMKALDAVGKKIGKAASAKKKSKRISEECKAALDGLVTSRRAILQGYTF